MLTDCMHLEKIEGESLIAIKDCVELTVRGLEVYVHESQERLLQAARGDRVYCLEAVF